MSPALDALLVSAALALCAGYALFALGPRSWRRRALASAAGWAARLPASLGLEWLAQRLRAAAASSASGGCGGCESCADGSPDGSTAEGAPREVNVPLARIGRRGR